MQTQISVIAANGDFKVNMQTGEAFISQRKTAEITGVPRTTIRDWLKADREKVKNENCPPTYNVNEDNQLDAKSLQKLVLSAHLKGYEKCTVLLDQMLEAGATAFICHMAGVILQPKVDPTLPQTHIEAVRAYLVTLETVEAQAKQMGIQAEVIQYKKAITNEGDTYFTIARVKELNQGMKFSGSKLSRESDDQELPPIKQNSMYGVNTPFSYHKEVWEAVYPNIVLPE